MKSLFNRFFEWDRNSRGNAWLRLRILIWGIEDIILPTLLIEMYEKDMRDILSVFRRDDSRLVVSGLADK